MSVFPFEAARGTRVPKAAVSGRLARTDLAMHESRPGRPKPTARTFKHRTRS
jgi:hypothetical protein